MTARGLAAAQLLVIVAVAAVGGATVYAVGSITGSTPLTLAVASGLFLVTSLSLLWASLDLARDRAQGRGRRP